MSSNQDDFLFYKSSQKYSVLFVKEESFNDTLPLEEILREKSFSSSSPTNFWLLRPIDFHSLFSFKNSSFLKSNKNKYYVIISSNKIISDFIKLRLGSFKTFHFNSSRNQYEFEKTLNKKEKFDGFEFITTNTDSLVRFLLSSQILLN